MPSAPKAAMYMKASGTPPELAKTAAMLSMIDVSLELAFLTITNVKKAPRRELITDVMTLRRMLVTNAWR